VDQFESLCEIEENEVKNNNDEISSDEDNVEHSSDNEEHTDTSTGNYMDENLDQLATKGRRALKVEIIIQAVKAMIDWIARRTVGFSKQ
jgi:hypothetical protein